MTNRFVTTKEHKQCPDQIYKYIGNVDYVFNAIEKETIHFTLSDKFNDPFDCKVVNDGFVLDVDCCGDKHIVCSIINKILLECSEFFVPFFERRKDFNAMRNDFLQAIKSKIMIAPSEYLRFVYVYSEYSGSFSDFYNCIKQSYIKKQPIVSLCRRVSCFSETNSSIPMWAYYADNHKGVCLEYTPMLLNDKETYDSIQKVNYTECQKNDARSCESVSDLNSMYFSKSICWEHEREWRLVLERDIEELYFPCLTGIYLGVNFRKEHGKADVFSRIIGAIHNSKNEISLYEAVPNNYQYKLNFNCIMPAKGW